MNGPSNPVQATNYDVLSDESGGKYILENYKNHVGNSRFEVLVEMYREAYELGSAKNDTAECSKIVDRLIGVICHRNVASEVRNRGRFLVKIPTMNGSTKWDELGDEKSAELVRHALVTKQLEEEEEEDLEPLMAFSSALAAFPPMVPDGRRKRDRRRSLLRRSASETTMLDDKKKTYRTDLMEQQENGGGGAGGGREQQHRRRIMSTMYTPRGGLAISDDFNVGANSSMSSAAAAATASFASLLDSENSTSRNSMTATPDDSSNTIKASKPSSTNYRTSLNIINDGADKLDLGSNQNGGNSQQALTEPLTENQDNNQQLHSQLQACLQNNLSIGSDAETMVSSYKPMDIVLNKSGIGLCKKPGLIGNNRLEVMLSLQRGRYPTLPEAEQTKVADDLVKAVMSYWGGRFLVDGDPSYMELRRDKAVAAVKSLLAPPVDAQVAPPVAPQVVAQVSHPVAPQVVAPIPAPQIPTAGANSRNSITNSISPQPPPAIGAGGTSGFTVMPNSMAMNGNTNPNMLPPATSATNTGGMNMHPNMNNMNNMHNMNNMNINHMGMNQMGMSMGMGTNMNHMNMVGTNMNTMNNMAMGTNMNNMAMGMNNMNMNMNMNHMNLAVGAVAGMQQQQQQQQQFMSSYHHGQETPLSRATSMPIPSASLSSVAMGTTGAPPDNIVMPPTTFNRGQSVDMLRSGLNPEAQNMQSAAVKSLQQRKAKRGLAKRLGQGKTTSNTVLDGVLPPATFMRLNNLDSQQREPKT